MASRIDLHNLLKSILGTNNVYYQPPETLKLNYPCIVYTRMVGQTNKADNIKYLHNKCYKITYIDKSIDSPIIDSIIDLKYCKHDNHFVFNNLSHDVFTLYF